MKIGRDPRYITSQTGSRKHNKLAERKLARKQQYTTSPVSSSSHSQETEQSTHSNLHITGKNPAGPKKPHGVRVISASGRAGVRGVRYEAELEEGEDEDVLDEEVEEPQEVRWEEHVFDHDLNAVAKVEQVTVDLSNIMRPGKVRSSKAGDFEVVPTLRSVVALDDHFAGGAPMPQDLGYDDGDGEWEYLDGLDSLGGPSTRHNKDKLYADVLR